MFVLFGLYTRFRARWLARAGSMLTRENAEQTADASAATTGLGGDVRIAPEGALSDGKAANGPREKYHLFPRFGHLFPNSDDVIYMS